MLPWRQESLCMRLPGNGETKLRLFRNFEFIWNRGCRFPEGGVFMEPLLWLIVLAVLLIIEAITVGLTTIWFAGGALIAAVLSWMGMGIAVQWGAFLLISLVLLIFTRPLAVRYMNRGMTKTNVDSLIGEKAVVIQEINNLAQTGQVRINDIEWMARTVSDEELIPANTVVEIEAVRGVKLIVKKQNISEEKEVK